MSVRSEDGGHEMRGEISIRPTLRRCRKKRTRDFDGDYRTMPRQKTMIGRVRAGRRQKNTECNAKETRLIRPTCWRSVMAVHSSASTSCRRRAGVIQLPRDAATSRVAPSSPSSCAASRGWPHNALTAVVCPSVCLSRA